MIPEMIHTIEAGRFIQETFPALSVRYISVTDCDNSFNQFIYAGISYDIR